MLCNAYNSSSREQEYINMLLRNQVDGIIIGSHTLKNWRLFKSKSTNCCFR